jgi:uncharacterized membrane protein YfcA
LTHALAFVASLVAAFLGGTANALAGGGQFLIFPALLLAGVEPVRANATSSLVVLPGVVTSTWVYRPTLRTIDRSLIFWLSLMSLAGSAIGALLLLHTPNASFSRLVPWLLLLATLVYTFAARLIPSPDHAAHKQAMPALLAGQLIITIYGGYFGAGMGIILISLFLLVTPLDVHASKGLRTLSTTVVNVLVVILFAVKGALDYTAGLPMLVAAVLGGYAGAHWVTRLKEDTVRRVILIYAWLLTGWFFVRTFGV